MLVAFAARGGTVADEGSGEQRGGRVPQKRSVPLDLASLGLGPSRSLDTLFKIQSGALGIWDGRT